jgi:hypothetical protein
MIADRTSTHAPFVAAVVAVLAASCGGSTEPDTFVGTYRLSALDDTPLPRVVAVDSPDTLRLTSGHFYFLNEESSIWISWSFHGTAPERHELLEILGSYRIVPIPHRGVVMEFSDISIFHAADSLEVVPWTFSGARTNDTLTLTAGLWAQKEVYVRWPRP